MGTKYIYDDGHVIGDVSMKVPLCVILGVSVLITAIIMKVMVEKNKAESKIVSRTPAGIIQSARRFPGMPGGFCQPPTKGTTEVTTDTIGVLFYSHPIIKIGAEAELLKDSRGGTWFTWKGHGWKYRIAR